LNILGVLDLVLRFVLSTRYGMDLANVASS
jgi:hypothetical protein